MSERKPVQLEYACLCVYLQLECVIGSTVQLVGKTLLYESCIQCCVSQGIIQYCVCFFVFNQVTKYMKRNLMTSFFVILLHNGGFVKHEVLSLFMIIQNFKFSIFGTVVVSAPDQQVCCLGLVPSCGMSLLLTSAALLGRALSNMHWVIFSYLVTPAQNNVNQHM